jgi:hypothetical protein
MHIITKFHAKHDNKLYVLEKPTESMQFNRFEGSTTYSFAMNDLYETGGNEGAIKAGAFNEMYKTGSYKVLKNYWGTKDGPSGKDKGGHPGASGKGGMVSKNLDITGYWKCND